MLWKAKTFDTAHENETGKKVRTKNGKSSFEKLSRQLLIFKNNPAKKKASSNPNLLFNPNIQIYTGLHVLCNFRVHIKKHLNMLLDFEGTPFNRI